MNVPRRLSREGIYGYADESSPLARRWASRSDCGEGSTLHVVKIKRGKIFLLGDRGKLFDLSRFADSARTENIQNLKRQSRRGAC